MKAVYALYADGHAAQQAVNRLRAAGLKDPDITVLSGRPMEEFEFGNVDKTTWMWWIACGGALIGMAVAYGLAWISENSWPMNVGGLPIFAWWPNLIIMFEMTMLGAILATVATLFMSALVTGRRRPRFYDPEVSDGYILVGVEAARDDARIAEVLSATGGRIKATS